MKRNSIFVLMLISSFFSISKLPLNPVYIVGGSGILATLILISMRLKINKDFVVFGLFFLLILIVQYVAVVNTGRIIGATNVTSFLLFSYCFLLGACAVSISQTVTIETRRVMYRRLYSLLVIFLLLEASLRFFIAGGDGEGFYKYKYSILYFDSNFVGLVVLNFLFFYYYLNKIHGFLLSRKIELLLWILLICTFSRAAVITAVLCYFMLYKVKMMKYTVFFMAAMLIVILIYLLNQYLNGVNFIGVDGSFNSKFNIISKAVNLFSTLDIKSKMFGIGLNNFRFYENIFAHNILVTLVVEFGVIGMLLLSTFFVYVYRKTKGNVLYVLIPNVIAGFSLFSAYTPFLFVLTALIFSEEKNRNVR